MIVYICGTFARRGPRLYKPSNFKEKGKLADILVLFVCLFVFVALRPMSTAMVIGGRSVHLTTLFPGQA